MRLNTPGADPPAEIDKYLLPYERQVIAIRRHPALLIGPIAAAVAGLIGAIALNVALPSKDSGLAIVGWLICAVLFIRLAWKTALWAVEYFVVTSQRMILTSGVITRKVAMMPLVKVTDMSFQRSLLGQLLGYGEFILESSGQDQALRNVDHIPDPEDLYLRVCGLIFPDKGNADGGD